MRTYSLVWINGVYYLYDFNKWSPIGKSLTKWSIDNMYSNDESFYSYLEYIIELI